MAKTRDIKASCVFAAMPRIASFLIGLVDGSVNLGTKIGRGGAGPEVSAESGGKERAENNLGATRIEFSQNLCIRFFRNMCNLPEHGERQPQEEDKLEDKVEGEPVDDVKKALNHSKKGEDDPVLTYVRIFNFICYLARGLTKTYRQPLRIVILVLSEEGTEGVVSGDDEARKVGQKLTTEVEDDEEEVKSDDANYGISFGNTSLPLQVVKRGVLGQL